VRRCVRIRIDPKTDRPWKRAGFKHHPLQLWVGEHRAELVRACLVLGRAWIAAGRPMGAAKLGSFDEYAAIMSGILGVIGVPGFLDNAEELYEAADDSSSAWREFVSEWVVEFGSKRWLTPKDVRELCIKKSLLLDVLGDKSERSQVTKLGAALASKRDCVFGELTIVAEGAKGRGKHYRVMKVEDHIDSQASGQAILPFENEDPKPVADEQPIDGDKVEHDDEQDNGPTDVEDTYDRHHG
jgi:hypothetical protein